MRLIFMLFLLITITAASAQTAKDEYLRGYRDCNLNRLSACQNSNQLFFGPHGKRVTPRKPQISAALQTFLRGAPKTYMTDLGHTVSFDVAENAEAEFLGPDGPPEKLASGEWLFRGFEPHASPFSAYVMFDAVGNILLVGTVGTDTDTPKPPERSADYILRIYSRSGDPRPDVVAKWQGWARHAVGEKSKYPGVLPPNRFVGTELIIANGNKWSSRWLDR